MILLGVFSSQSVRSPRSEIKQLQCQLNRVTIGFTNLALVNVTRCYPSLFVATIEICLKSYSPH